MLKYEQLLIVKKENGHEEPWYPSSYKKFLKKPEILILFYPTLNLINCEQQSACLIMLYKFEPVRNK